MMIRPIVRPWAAIRRQAREARKREIERYQRDADQTIEQLKMELRIMADQAMKKQD
jgi:hypothetical protein